MTSIIRYRVLVYNTIHIGACMSEIQVATDVQTDGWTDVPTDRLTDVQTDRSNYIATAHLGWG